MTQLETPEQASEQFVLPASFAQQRMWFLQRLDGGAVYNVPSATRLRGPLDVGALRQSLNTIAERHESLRTVFALIDGVPHQVIRAAEPVALEIFDVSRDPGREERALELVSEQAGTPFDLSSQPPMRVALIKLGPEDHLLTLTLHHIASDAWSMGVFARELSELYRGFVSGQPVELEELPIQYADYAAWQHEWMASGGLGEQLAYWREKLEGAPTLLELPTDKPRPAVQSLRGQTVRAVFPAELAQRVRALGEREGATVFMTLLAAFATLLSRYSGGTDIVIGTPVANRNRVELERVIGLFVNTLPLRIDLEGDPTFAALLRRIRQTSLDAFSNQDLPFERLVEELAPERSRSHAPVAQVLFVLQNSTDGPAPLAGLEQERISADRGTAKFDLTLFAGEVREGLRVAVEYCSELFERATVERMLEHFRVLLEAAVAEPDRPVSELPLVGEQELKELRSFSEGGDAARVDRCVHELVSEQAQRSGDEIAVSFGERRLSYAELDMRANQLARRLRDHGIGPDKPVAICMERSLEMAVAVLGVLKAGGAYAPIDPSYPKDRVAFMLADADAPVVVTQERLLARLPVHRASVICLDPDAMALAGAADTPPDSGVTPDHLAYVLYTSGSTGRPKGVAMEHRALANLIAWQHRTWSPPSAARTLQFASLSFDVAFQEMFCTWSAGGTLVLVSDEARRDPRALLQVLAEENVERLFLPFVALHNLCEAAEESNLSLPRLRDVITAGEQLKATGAIRRFFARHDSCTLHNHYGPTESHVVSSFRLTDDPERWPALPPIGRPIAGAKLHLLDRHRQPVPIGVPGELYIGGVSLARGYLNRDELTAERFVADRPGSDPPARLYRTGDLARYLPDGNIAYVRRVDDQVKLRGFRVEPGEIEAALREQPGVREALVAVREDPPGERRLVAYVLTNEAAPSASELHERCSQTLPEYMVPSAFVTLDAFPLSPNGKVDRRALPAPDVGSFASDEFVAPRTDLERALAALWESLLGVERVGMNDNFFALGGHSLLAVRLISRLQDQLGYEVPLGAVFDNPTVETLARSIPHTGERSARPPITPVPRHSRVLAGTEEEVCVLPVSFAQQRLWFLDRLEPRNPAYNVPIAVRLRGALDVVALERALGALVQRHESLRTTLAMLDGAPQQVIRPVRPVPLEIADLSRESDAEAAARRLVARELRTGFDLSAGPLLRARLIRFASDEHIFMLTLHHIVIDGWSIGILRRELSELYGAFARGETPALNELPIQYADFAVSQQEWMQQGGLHQQLEYWKEQLAGAPALLELPTDRPRPSRPSLRGGVVRSVLAPAKLEECKRLGDEHGATLFMTLLAAFAALLSRYSGQGDVVIASPVANRNRMELEDLIGFFVNTLPLRVSVEGDPSFAALLARVRDIAVGGFTHQDAPFEKLVEELKPDRDLSFAPITQVSFVLNTLEGSLELPGLEAAHVPGPRRTTKYDLGLYAAQAPDGLRLSIEYSTDLFDETTAERMLAHYRNLLEAALSNPEEPVSALGLLDDAERLAVLNASHASEVEYPVACLHELFERRVAVNPDATALISEGTSLSYGQLNARANQLAHRLLALGAGPETMVALAFEPSPAMVIAIIGVLKAGAAYVPLDPDYPAERLAFVLDDTAAPILVAHEQVVERLPSHGAQLVVLDSEGLALAGERTTDPVSRADPDNLAYVIYTSGSTGKPKGVLIEHRQVARLLSATDAWFRFGPADTWTLLHSYAFDFSVWELWGALAYGGRVVISPRMTTRSPSALAELIADRQVTVLNATPSLFLAVQEELLRVAGRLSLRVVIFGGEALAPPSLRPWMQRFGSGGPALVNMYGITETAVHVTYRPLTVEDCELPLSPIGAPIPDLALYLLDSRLEPVPPGVVGELLVGGAGVARGYLNRPRLTAERFIESPFGAGRLYRTGDRARRLPGGELEFRGRIDDQVKIRGFRIELGEIRAALAEHPAVAETEVVAVAGPGGPRVAAYVVAADRERIPGRDELRSHLADRLPNYMIPAGWVYLEALPLTRNGKVDRKSLPAPEYDRAAAADRFVAPSTDLERRLAAIWSEVLGIDRVGIDDDFFELGGHSILAVALFSEIERAFDVPLPLSVLFRTGTIRTLAAELHAGGPDADEPTVLELQPHGQGPPVFCICGVHVYQALANALAPNVPMYGIWLPTEQALFQEASGTAAAEDLSVATMADEYVRALRAQQPAGPYRLLGFCFGGLVAYEMAQQLQAAGEDVSLLVMMDTMLGGALKRRRVRLFLRRMKRRGRGGADEIRQRLGLPAIDATLSETERLGLRRIRVYAKIAKSYEPRPYSRSAVLLKPQGTWASEADDLVDGTYGWGALVDRLVVHDVPGDHVNHLQRPHVEAVAGVLSQYLEGDE